MEEANDKLKFFRKITRQVLANLNDYQPFGKDKIEFSEMTNIDQMMCLTVLQFMTEQQNIMDHQLNIKDYAKGIEDFLV